MSKYMTKKLVIRPTYVLVFAVHWVSFMYCRHMPLHITYCMPRHNTYLKYIFFHSILGIVT